MAQLAALAASVILPCAACARPQWMVVNLIDNSIAFRDYDLETANAVFNTDEFKTTNMVFRLVEKGNYAAGYGTYAQNSSHTVSMTNDYYIGIFPVTAHQYARMKGTSVPTGSSGLLPIVNANYYTLRGTSMPTSEPKGVIGDFNANFTTFKFDLPTESMWEVAARAGTSGRWFFGDSSAIGSYAWYKSNSGSTRHAVGGKLPNQWGLYDVYGNVGEWCLDAYQQKLHTHTDGLTPTFASGNSKRVYRGGKFSEPVEKCSSYERAESYVSGPGVSLTSSDITKDKIGFRLAASPTWTGISGDVMLTKFSPIDDTTWRIEFEAERDQLAGDVSDLKEYLSFSVRRGSTIEELNGEDAPYADFTILTDECSVDGDIVDVAIRVEDITGPVNFLKVSGTKSE